MQNEETTQSFLTAAKVWDRGFVKNYGQNKKNNIRNKILNGGSAGLWQGMKMAMDRPQDSIPYKMANGETLVVGEEAVAHEFASYFRRKV
jgi:hypothetical protein